MEARSLYMNAMEIAKAKEKANVVGFPKRIEVISCTNDTYKESKRIEAELQRMELENKARQYSRRCRAIREMKEDIMCIISGVSLVVSMVAGGFILAAFM